MAGLDQKAGLCLLALVTVKIVQKAAQAGLSPKRPQLALQCHSQGILDQMDLSFTLGCPVARQKLLSDFRSTTPALQSDLPVGSSPRARQQTSRTGLHPSYLTSFLKTFTIAYSLVACFLLRRC